jgi:predicted small integral membrane protein
MISAGFQFQMGRVMAEIFQTAIFFGVIFVVVGILYIWNRFYK